MNLQNNSSTQKLRINHFIRVPQVRVILEDGSTAGIMSTRDAIMLAQEQGMDLIEINPKSVPPIAKIMNYGKFRYEEKKKVSESRKSQKAQELKELTFRPNTDENDLNHKLTQAKEFLSAGHRVKFTVKFRGREIVHPQVGREKLEWIMDQLKEIIISSPMILTEGKIMSMITTPVKKF
jgi:translation initiation factor IF-3